MPPLASLHTLRDLAPMGPVPRDEPTFGVVESQSRAPRFAPDLRQDGGVGRSLRLRPPGDQRVRSRLPGGLSPIQLIAQKVPDLIYAFDPVSLPVLENRRDLALGEESDQDASQQ